MLFRAGPRFGFRLTGTKTVRAASISLGGCDGLLSTRYSRRTAMLAHPARPLGPGNPTAGLELVGYFLFGLYLVAGRQYRSGVVQGTLVRPVGARGAAA